MKTKKTSDIIEYYKIMFWTLFHEIRHAKQFKLLDKYKVSGKSKTTYARENGRPEATSGLDMPELWQIYSENHYGLSTDETQMPVLPVDNKHRSGKS